MDNIVCVAHVQYKLWNLYNRLRGIACCNLFFIVVCLNKITYFSIFFSMLHHWFVETGSIRLLDEQLQESFLMIPIDRYAHDSKRKLTTNCQRYELRLHCSIRESRERKTFTRPLCSSLHIYVRLMYFSVTLSSSAYGIHLQAAIWFEVSSRMDGRGLQIVRRMPNKRFISGWVTLSERASVLSVLH